MTKLNKTPVLIRARRGTRAQITATSPAPYQKEGEIAYATDTKQFYVSDGSSFNPISLTRTSSSSDPTTSELQNDKDASIHKNTTSGNVFLAYNDGGNIVKTQLS
jgi:hypothetical protein